MQTERKTGAAFPSPFKFQKYGQSGIEVSELFAHDGRASIDDIARHPLDVRRGAEPRAVADADELRRGSADRPSIGSWVTYGLGTENQNLPGFIAMCPGGYPIQGAQNWQAAFLPGVYQGRTSTPSTREIEKLIENIRNDRLPLDQQRRQLDLLQQLNRRHREARQRRRSWKRASSRSSWPSACRPKRPRRSTSAASRSTSWTCTARASQARQMLIARRLVERGVRFVQVWHGAGQPWDNHDDIEVSHRKLAKRIDQPIAALLTDLKQRGLLDDTLVIWGGEFGRTPTVELPNRVNAGKINGRDHNHYGFTHVAGRRRRRRRHVHGATDEFGFQAVENRVHVHDLHATMLHLLGFDHERLTYRYAGRDFRLTDVHGKVVKELVA